MYKVNYRVKKNRVFFFFFDGRLCIDLLIDIRNVQFSHVKRKGNTLAHLLAKHARGIVDFLV